MKIYSVRLPLKSIILGVVVTAYLRNYDVSESAVKKYKTSHSLDQPVFFNIFCVLLAPFS